MNIDEYISSACQLVRSNVDREEGCITAAKLGTLLRRSNSLTWEQLGFRSLKDFLLVLEQRQLIRLGESSKGALAVWPVGESTIAKPQSSPRRVDRGPSFGPIKKPFWVAFAVERPPGRRFFNRISHEIRLGSTGVPTPAGEWIEINPAAATQQKDWAREFIEFHSLQGRSELQAALSAPDWYQTFWRLLGLLKPELAKEWNRHRSALVAQHIQEWCQRNSVSPEVAFQGPGEMSLSGDARTPQVASGSPQSAVRDSILGALSRMTTSELLEIPIPAKYLLRVEISSDKLE